MSQQQSASPKQSARSLREVLERQLNDRDLRLAESTLRLYPPAEVFAVLGEILEGERQRARRRRAVDEMLRFGLSAAYLIWFVYGFAWDQLGLFLAAFLALRLLQGAIRSYCRSLSLREKNVRFVLPSLVERAPRSDLEHVLTVPLTGAKNPEPGEWAVLQKLGSWLARLPEDELALLSHEARRGLRRLTPYAITLSRKDPRAEELAIACLLALGSLKDRTATQSARSAAEKHPRGHVSAAAEEYLSQIAN